MRRSFARLFLYFCLPFYVTAAAFSPLRPAFAQSEASAAGLKMAQDLVQDGRSLGQQGNWDAALERFRKASSLSPKMTPQLAFYVGYAEAKVGKLVAAGVDLRRAIELSHVANNDQVGKAAQAELLDLDARTPALTIAVHGGTAATALQIDGGTLGVGANASPLDPRLQGGRARRAR